MKRKYVVSGLGLLLGVAALGLAFYSLSYESTLHNRAGENENSSGRQKASSNTAERYVSTLIAEKKIEGSVLRLVRGRAFSIVRNEQRPDGDALNYVRSLLEKSKAGDASATYEIYIAVSQCNATLQPPAQGVLDAYREVGAEVNYLKSIDKRFQECKSLTEDFDLMRTPWLDLAAQQGSIEAMVMYASDPDSVIGSPSEYLSHADRLVDYRKKAVGYLQQAAGMGSVDALMALGRAYDSGIITEKSAIKSYAYYKALESVQPNTDLQAVLEVSRKSLNQAQVSQADRLAGEIVNSCCTQ
ncbi:hypothetical protein [Xanthomonas hortorum]|uniref:hypothetical protein n=1 Tax=Xanthomonas hortorum TaxID=56454 RepID=UPI002936C1B2|nr:hypothetical protein [Xanthomonas hortorum]MDV2453666.1 hypothetical protein [Xanthomonas hortorum NBC5720]